MIRHSVIFKFKETISNIDQETFFAAVDTLADIPDVLKFEVLNQINPKNKFEYGISMEFDNQEQYDIYSNHPVHVDFIQNFWIPNVEDFLEIDFTLTK